ncbi:MAG TPA: 23S rRNA (guanosine(2251)-2'-O)-methyltransferase RlmB [Thermomicrobiales bacterium]|nr:23S rRNA (guanosine(2251)-2'-O)-methyltransferase RlmB [Thermomicrobiales bacterium]
MRTHRQERSGAARNSDSSRRRTGEPIERLYGRNAVLESLIAGRRRFVRLLVAESATAGQRLADIESLATSHGAPIERVTRSVLDTLVKGHSQGVALEAYSYPYVSDYDLHALAQARSVVLALDGLVDPQNVGSLLRTAEATGVSLVVIPTDRAAQVTPAVVNASSGAVEHLNIATVTNLARWLGRARDSGYWVVGMAGDESADPLFDTRMTPPIVLVVGSEGGGMRRLVREQCDLLVSLPMMGRVTSLNASVAGSIGLYEIRRDTDDSLNE